MGNYGTIRHAENHPAIQNLRYFLKDYLKNDHLHSLNTFAQNLNKTPREVGRYLRGECTPRKIMIEKWAEAFGVDYDYMMTSNFPYLDYPFDHESVPKKSGKHITKKEIRQNYDEMLSEINTYLLTKEDDKYLLEIMEIIKRHRI